MADLTHARALVVDFRTASNVLRELRRQGRTDQRSQVIQAVVDETRAGGTGREVLLALTARRLSSAVP